MVKSFSDDELMGLALREAEAAMAAKEVPIGCVFVHPDEGVVGRGHNDTVRSCNATRHAELVAIDGMQQQGRDAATVAACTVYVTIEPCIMCASALRQMGVRSVVFGAPNDKFGGCGSVLSAHSDAPDAPLPVMSARAGVRGEEAVALLRLFYAQENSNAPVPQKRTRNQLVLAEGAAATLQELEHTRAGAPRGADDGRRVVEGRPHK